MDVNTIFNIAILIVSFWIARYIKQQDTNQKNNLAFQEKTKKELDLYQAETKDEMNEIKLNYLDRFDEVKKLIVDTSDKQFDKIINIVNNHK